MTQTPDIFRISGATVTPTGDLLCNLQVAIVDRDTVSDDLLGVGVTDDEGRFRLSFTRREFNQDLFENEALPDIAIIFSAPFDGFYRAVAVMEFPDLRFEHGQEELGDIALTSWTPEGFVPLTGVDPTPGYSKRVQRLDLDDELVRRCLAEVAPLVEAFTGWRDLLEGLKVDVTDAVTRYTVTPMLESMGFESSLTTDLMVRLVGDYAMNFMALYDPLTHTVVVHETHAARTNLDALKVVLGHELVHVGQFKNEPGLLTRYQTMIADLGKLGEQLHDGDADIAALAESFRESPLQAVMEDLEGYAYYIQRDFLEKHYNMATFFHHRSWLEWIFQGALQRLAPGVDTIKAVKHDQYLQGAERFRGQARGELPARFDVGD